MSWLGRLFKDPPRIRIDPGTALTEKERELAIWIGLRVKLTYPFHNEAAMVSETKERYHVDDETARWWVTHTISAMKDAGQLAEAEPLPPETPAPAERVVVGKCEQCGRDLRVKRSGVRPRMQLTCKCGHLNHIPPEQAAPTNETNTDRVPSPEAELATRVHQMSTGEMVPLLRKLCAAYTSNETREIERLEPIATAIGQELNARGGITEMRRVWQLLDNMRGTRTLDMHWGGIGDWLG